MSVAISLYLHVDRFGTVRIRNAHYLSDIYQKNPNFAFVQYSECLSNQIHRPFYVTQIINLFLNSRISANHDKGYRDFELVGKSLYSLLFL